MQLFYLFFNYYYFFNGILGLFFLFFSWGMQDDVLQISPGNPSEPLSIQTLL